MRRPRNGANSSSQRCFNPLRHRPGNAAVFELVANAIRPCLKCESRQHPFKASTHHMFKTTFATLCVTILLCAVCSSGAASDSAAAQAPPEATPHKPEVLETDDKLHLDFGDEHVVLPRGLQPSMLVTQSGSIILQGQIPEKSFPSSRMAYPWALSTRVSRDGGLSWSDIPLKSCENGLNMEGGIVQLHDGTILSLDTYIIPGEHPDEGIGQLYTSHDDWRTVTGPTDAVFDLPGIEFYGSSDDGGRPHAAQACIGGSSRCRTATCYARFMAG